MLFMPSEEHENIQTVWREFYRIGYVLYEYEPKKHCLVPPVSRDFLEYVEGRRDLSHSAALKIQAFWNRLRSKDTLIRVNPRGFHSREFHHFLNYSSEKKFQVKKSIHRAKLSLLLTALELGLWDHVIFTEPTLPELAMALYAARKISLQQISSILEYVQALKNYKLKKSYPLLESDGSFTQVAWSHFLPALQKRTNLRLFSMFQIEVFRTMVACLPRSEQMFYLTDKGKLHHPYPPRELGHLLIHLGSILSYQGALVHMSAGVRDALGIVAFGEHYVRPQLRLGSFSREDIEFGMLRRVRYTTIHYPDTTPYGTVHGFSSVDGLAATAHDVYHSLVASSLSDTYLKILTRFVVLIRKHCGYTWSQEIWDWVDADYRLFFDEQGILTQGDIELSSKSLCQLLEYGGNARPDRAFCAGSGLMRYDILTPVGMIILIDMVRNRHAWLELQIDPKFFTEKFYKYYKIILKLYDPYLKEENSIMQVFKLQCYLVLHAQKNVHAFTAIHAVIQSQSHEIQRQCAFRKRPFNKDDFLSYSLEFMWQGHAVTFMHIARWIANVFQTRYPSSPKLAEEYFLRGLFKLGYDLRQAVCYASLRLHGKHDEHVQFLVKPTVINWLTMHYKQFFLFFLSIILIPLAIWNVTVAIFYANRRYKSIADRDYSLDALSQAFDENSPPSKALTQWSLFCKKSPPKKLDERHNMVGTEQFSVH